MGLTAATGGTGIRLRKNGVAYSPVPYSLAATEALGATALVQLAAGDYVSVATYATGGGTAANGAITSFSGRLLG